MIEDLADKLIYNIGINQPPVKIADIEQYLNATIVYYPFKKVEGICSPIDKVVGVNKNLPKIRRRFIAAHELSHIALGHRRNLYRFGIKTKDEKEASQLAAALLVPKWLLLEEIRQHQPENEQDIADLAEKFDVSYTVMTRRLKEVNIGNETG